jgi:hypothetical protein
MGTPNIDLFATRANSQLPVFILVVLEEHPLLTPEVEETKTDVELRALPEELSNSLV